MSDENEFTPVQKQSQEFILQYLKLNIRENDRDQINIEFRILKGLKNYFIKRVYGIMKLKAAIMICYLSLSDYNSKQKREQVLTVRAFVFNDESLKSTSLKI